MDTNLDEIIEGDLQDTYNLANESLDKLKPDIKKLASDYGNYLDNLPNTNIKKKVTKYQPKYFTFTWRMYRTASLLFIFIMIFVLRYVAVKIETKYDDPYVKSIYNIVSVFLLLNICLFCFRVVFKKYRETVIGKKGVKGPRGKQGQQGKSDYCDITKPKIKKFRRSDGNLKHNEIIVNNKMEEEKQKLKAQKKYKWKSVGSSSQCGASPHDSIINNKKIGYLQDQPRSTDFIEDNDEKPLIGVQANYSTDYNTIDAVQYLVDSNKTHNKKSYNIKVLEEKTFGNPNPSVNNKKGTFICPNNSAIYKIEGAYDSNELKGLKYYCADVITGKNVKSYDLDNRKGYGVTIGVEPDPSSKDYYYDKIECNLFKDNEKSYPSFISSIGSDTNTDANANTLKNLYVNKCSIYAP